jgi:hypothetical protein
MATWAVFTHFSVDPHLRVGEMRESVGKWERFEKNCGVRGECVRECGEVWISGMNRNPSVNIQVATVSTDYDGAFTDV